MRTLPGIGIGRASVVGRVVRVHEAPPVVARSIDAIGSPEEELAIARAALEDVGADLRSRASRLAGIAADILGAQALMALDPDLLDEVTDLVLAGASADRAIAEGYGVYREMLLATGTHLAERVADVDDVCRRALAKVAGVEVAGLPHLLEPSVLVARDLAPADTVDLDPEMVLAFITLEGGPTSHTAILARARGIPAIVGCEQAGLLEDGDEVLVDSLGGVVVQAPGVDQIERAHERSQARAAAATGNGRTADGVAVALLANIGGVDDVAGAVAAGAEGVGLLRTEFMFLDRADAPGIEEQVEAYVAMLEGMAGHKVVARVLDAGADKPLSFLNAGAEPNPALGVRGLRSLRKNLDVLDTQLAALAQAAARTEAELWVMAPMVADVDEARWFVARAREHGLQTCGVMIEVPAAALTASVLLPEVDFVSIGTNDLAQYTLAADRMLGAVGAFLDPWQPAVLRLVQMVAQAGAAQGVKVSVCGEAAADPLLACALVGVGVRALSMSANALAEVRTTLADTTLEGCQRVADAILSCGSAAAARRAVAALGGDALH